VQYSGGQVTVATTTNYGAVWTTQGTLAGTFANGDTLTAEVDATGTVLVWKTTAGNVTTYLGAVSAASQAFTTGTGSIGMNLSNGSRVDNFAGGSL